MKPKRKKLKIKAKLSPQILRINFAPTNLCSLLFFFLFFLSQTRISFILFYKWFFFNIYWERRRLKRKFQIDSIRTNFEIEDVCSYKTMFICFFFNFTKFNSLFFLYLLTHIYTHKWISLMLHTREKKKITFDDMKKK